MPTSLRFLYASVLRDAGRYRDAIEVISTLVRGSRPAVATLLLQAYCEEALSDYRAAVQSYRRVIRRNPKNVRAKHGLKFCLARVQKTAGTA